jgi:hypothetical protein
VSNALVEVDFHAPALASVRDRAMALAEAVPEIVDTPSCEQAVQANAQVAKAIALVAKARLTVTRSLDAAKKEIMDKEKEFVAPLQEATAIITQGIDNYMVGIRRVEAERTQQAKEQEAAIAAVEGDAGQKHMTPMLVVVEPVLDKPNVPTRMVARLVIDVPSKIPQQFWKLDEPKLKQYLQDNPEAVNVGAHLEYDEVMVRRSI